MEAMKTPQNGPLYAAIGQALIGQLGNPTLPVWCYFEAGDGWLGGSAFIDHGAHAEWFDIDDSVSDAIFAAWESEPAAHRWQGMEYAIENGHFSTRFTYPDELDPKEFVSDREEAMIARHFGNKELRYPDW